MTQRLDLYAKSLNEVVKVDYKAPVLKEWTNHIVFCSSLYF